NVPVACVSHQCKGDPRMAATPEARLKQLNLTLPPTPKPMAKYKPAVQVGNVLYVSGHGPAKVDGNSPIVGRLGDDLSLEQGKDGARRVGLAVGSRARTTLGTVARARRLVKTLGMVNATPDFKDQPLDINGFSELMAEVFGDDAGVGARSAVGM